MQIAIASLLLSEINFKYSQIKVNTYNAFVLIRCN
ncbi:hypothetical protein T03_13297 [Trichinella britovi]|uniref:Uncharacterized protein n=1 Tax=Trichinella britovi TaxID=45882 RepID=A0A0V0YW29_TRIBR|nr:hypothetical protein T03_13297 [Trichinella britovi]